MQSFGEVWMLLMADDLKVEATSADPPRSIVFVILLLLVYGVPLAWNKVQGGSLISWLGYEVDLMKLALGITQSRADWCIGYLTRLARDGKADMGWMRSGLGRASFVVGALEWERPFLCAFT